MKIELFHYIHCPYCIRVRMALGLLNLSWDSHVLPYRDELTPIDLTGKKMLPIIKNGDLVLNESLEIIKYLDSSNILSNESWNGFHSVLDTLSPEIYNLAMPFWVHSPEFDTESQKYFLKKKEAKRGPFAELIKKRSVFESEIHHKLNALEDNLIPFWKSTQLTIKDIGLAAQLWGLFCVPEFKFSEKFYNYLMTIRELTHFNYTNFHWRQL